MHGGPANGVFQRPTDHGFPNHGFENGIIDRLINGIILGMNGMNHLINGVNRLATVIH